MRVYRNNHVTVLKHGKPYNQKIKFCQISEYILRIYFK